MSPPLVVVITDRPALGAAIERLLRFRPPVNGGVECIRMTYDQQAVFLTEERIQIAGLFVLELMRTYAQGIRAEGLVAASQLALRSAAPVLIVSQQVLGRELSTRNYWDFGSSDALEDRIAEMVGSGREQAPPELATIVDRFRDLLEIPRQH